MADGKKSFILYCDIIHTVDLLDDALAGKLMKHLLRYVNDQDPQTDNVLLKIAFEPIKQQLKRDLREWGKLREKRSLAGHNGGVNSGKSRKSKANEASASKKKQTKQSQANEAVNATATATANVNGSINTNTAAAVGAIKVKEIANKVWQDKMWVEQVCRGLSITPAALKKWMAQFNSGIADDAIVDFNVSRYKRMVRGWIAKQQAKGLKIEEGLQKTSSAPPLTLLKH